MGETKTQTSQAVKAASFKNGVSLHRLLETAPLDALEPFFRDVEDGAHASIFLTPAWPSQRDDAVILELRGHLLQVANSLASDVAVPLDRHAQRILTLADGRGTEALNRAAERLFDTEKIAAAFAQVGLKMDLSDRPLTLKQYDLSRFLSSLSLSTPTLPGFDIERVAVVEVDCRPDNPKHRAGLKVSCQRR